MKVTRRSALAVGAGGVVFAMFGGPTTKSWATPEDAAAIIKEFSGGAEPVMGGISLTTPEIAENGNTVPIGVSVDSAMTEDDNVKSVIILAEGNPRADVIRFNFSLANGVAAAKTRIRLAKTQNVVAVAKMGDGSVRMARNQVKVTIGGCGG